MPTVANKADNGGSIPNFTQSTDNKLEQPSRNNAGTPVAALTPAFPGELVMDTTNGILYRGVGTTNTNWMRVEQPVG